MVQHEYFPVLIEAKRNDLRAIAHPLPDGVVAPSWRHIIGLRLIQLGRWVEGARPAIAIETQLQPNLGEPVGSA